MVQAPRSKKERELLEGEGYLMLQRGGTWRPEEMPLGFDKQELTGASLVEPKFSGGGREGGTVQGGGEQCRV